MTPCCPPSTEHAEDTAKSVRETGLVQHCTNYLQQRQISGNGITFVFSEALGRCEKPFDVMMLIAITSHVED